MAYTSPLGPDHLAQIEQALGQLKDASQAIDMAKRAGVDVGTKEAEVEDARKRLMQIKAVYFAGQ